MITIIKNILLRLSYIIWPRDCMAGTDWASRPEYQDKMNSKP
jgi:hypothetical protein